MSQHNPQCFLSVTPDGVEVHLTVAVRLTKATLKAAKADPVVLHRAVKTECDGLAFDIRLAVNDHVDRFVNWDLN